MDSIVLICILLALVINIAVGVRLLTGFRRVTQSVERNFMEFITPVKPGEKSGLDEFVDKLSYNIGHSAFTQVRSMGAAAASAEVRGNRAVDAAISNDLLAQANPLIGGLLDSMPGLKKVLNKNPGLAEYALEKIMSKAAVHPEVPEGTGGNGYHGTTVDII